MTPRLTLAAALVAIVVLPSCALRPLYAGGGDSAVVTSLGRVQVAPVAGKAGWLVRNAVADRLGNSGGSPQYRLEIELDDQITGFGIRTDNAVTRERRTLRARYRLVDAAQGTVLLDQTAGSDAGVDVVSSEFATIAAEETALERLAEDIATQIVTRLALYSQRTARPQP